VIIHIVMCPVLADDQPVYYSPDLEAAKQAAKRLAEKITPDAADRRWDGTAFWHPDCPFGGKAFIGIVSLEADTHLEDATRMLNAMKSTGALAKSLSNRNKH